VNKGFQLTYLLPDFDHTLPAKRKRKTELEKGS